MPTNLYGPGDNYDPTGSHVLPALVRKFHEAKASGSDLVTLWAMDRHDVNSYSAMTWRKRW